MTYSKNSSDGNIDVKTKYAINKLHCLFSKKEAYENDGSIEHICPESIGGDALNIGNLILLEQEINNAAGQKEYAEKCRCHYKDSQYKWLQMFCETNADWDVSQIKQRAKKMAEVYFDCIIGDCADMDPAFC